MKNLKFNDSQRESNQVQQKLDELIRLINETSLNPEELEDLKNKFDSEIWKASGSTSLELYQNNKKVEGHSVIPEKDTDQLLFIRTDIAINRKHKVSSYIRTGLRILISILLILLGFGMIIMPAPPYFEMFTLFYLNPNDGVTIMDVISLIVAFIGVYILFTTIAGKRT